MAASNSLASPAFCAAVTPSDSTNLPNGDCRSLFIGSAGAVTLYPPGSNVGVLFSGLAAGQQLIQDTSRVLATGTTCTGIVAQY